ncbi:MAG: FecR domain-containing protein [Gammaproteobacteria bacterium]|nr:FecR domain-containing protein [Gammaproteobacteria bacterium]
MANEPQDDTSRGADLVATLIRAAGRRPEPPAAAYARTLAVATAALERRFAARRRRRWALALAAGVLLAAGVGLVLRSGPPPPGMVARVERVLGTVEWVQAPGGQWRSLASREPTLREGARVRTTSGGRAGLQLAGGASLRLAPGSEIELGSPQRLTLVHGRVYVDAGSGADPVAVVTTAGVARDVGTQFEVLFAGSSYRLRVREGLVVLQRGSAEARARAGDELSFRGAGPLQQVRIPGDDPQWQWTEELAPAPDIDGRPVRVLLAWVARETGREVNYASPFVERMAERTTLHGTIGSMPPLDALAVVLATTDLGYELLPDRTILITARTSPDRAP